MYQFSVRNLFKAFRLFWPRPLLSAQICLNDKYKIMENEETGYSLTSKIKIKCTGAAGLRNRERGLLRKSNTDIKENNKRVTFVLTCSNGCKHDVSFHHMLLYTVLLWLPTNTSITHAQQIIQHSCQGYALQVYKRLTKHPAQQSVISKVGELSDL